ncbi:MAG: type II secretion system protein GspJ [Phycisphaerales bacterium]
MGHNHTTTRTWRPGARAPRPAFTLVELIVATVITAMLAGAATLSMQRLIRARDRSKERQEAVTTIYAVTQVIARDISNIVRDPDLRHAMVRVTDDVSGSSGDESDGLLLFTRSYRPARPRDIDAEGAVYETQYRLDRDDDLGGVLWRRRDPVPDEFYDAGGVAVPIATGVLSLEIEAYDGSEWRDEWDSDIAGLPHALRVTCRGVMEGTDLPTVAQVVVAIDRTPTPVDPAAAELNVGPGGEVLNLFGQPTGESGGNVPFGGGGGGGGN